jgi:peptidyl-prolyl cis-trans isomerase SurA
VGRIICRGVAVFLVLFGISTSQAQVVGLDKVIAIVNDEAITFSEYQARYNRELLQNRDLASSVPNQIDINVLRALIDERLQAQMAKQRGIVVDESDVKNAIANMAEQNAVSIQQLYDQLLINRISELEFNRSIEEKILIQRLVDIAVKSRVNISDQEIDYHLQAHRELYSTNEVYDLSHLFVSTTGKSETEIQSDRDNLENIAIAIDNGLSFKKAVQDFSDSDNNEEGGYLGWRKEDQLPDLFLSALRETSVGGVTDVIESENGLHLLKIHGKEGDLKIVTQQMIRHILIRPDAKELTDEEALEYTKKILVELQNGAEFSRLARLHSDDNTSAATGGSLGWVNPGDTVPPFEAASRLLEIDELSKPVKSRFGYHLIQVQERRKKDISQDVARQKAYAEIHRRKSKELFDMWFGRIREAAFIEVVGQG